MADQDVQEIPQFVTDNSDVFGEGPPKWEDVKDDLASALPGQDLSPYKQAYTQAWNMGAARHLASHMEEQPGIAAMRHWLPLAGTVANMTLQKRASDAQDRLNAGTQTDEDYLHIALNEARQQRDAAQPWYTKAAQSAVKFGSGTENSHAAVQTARRADVIQMTIRRPRATREHAG